MKHGYSFMVFTQPGGRSRKFFLSRRLARTGAILSVVLILGFCAMLFYLVGYYRLSRQVDRMEEANRQLTVENSKINELKERMIELESVRRRLANMLGVDYAFSDSIPPASMGGSSEPLSSEAEPSSIENRFKPEGKPVEGIISRGYSENHPGLDLAAKTQAPVSATAEGIVLDVDYDEVFGNFVLVDHNGDYQTFYAHLSKSIVQPEQWVSRGDTLGFVGSTGKSTGPHLHYEVRREDDRVNPVLYLF
jgi:murein DD-endopeptidase MepM/ murein hydrolase activator NlpD